MGADSTSSSNDVDRTDGGEAEAVVRTFLIADVRGYTSFTQVRGDEEAGKLAARFAELAREAVAATGGKVIELRGDEALCVFTSARRALRAAVELQRRFRTPVEGEPAFPLGIGIGLAAGEAVPIESGYRGGALNLAARLCSLAGPGQILASETVTSLAGAVEGLRFLERRATQVKGMAKPVRVIEVVPETALPPVPAAPSPSTRRRRPVVLALGGVMLAGAIAVTALVLTGGSTDTVNPVAPNAVGVIDAERNQIVEQIPIAGEPARLASGKGSVWVGRDDSGTVSALDRVTHQPTNLIAVGGFPSDLSVGEGALWVVDGKSGLLRKVDLAYGTVAWKTRIAGTNRAYDASREGLDAVAVASGLGSVWITDGSERLVRVNPRNGRIIKRVDLHTPLNGTAVGGGAVWAVSGPSATAFRLDRYGTVTARIPIVSSPGFESPYPLSVRVGEGSVWVLNGNTATVTRIDPDQRAVVATISIGIDHAPVRLAVGGGTAWVANGDGTLSRIDAGTNTVETLSVGHRLKDVAVADGAVLVTAGSGLSSLSASSTYEGKSIGALPASSCSPIYYGGRGQPRYLIASDFPLQGTGRTELAQLGQAIQFVLREHEFRAGPYTVAYQSCDDSTAAAGGTAPEKCEANAHAYAESQSVIGVIGTWDSGCSATEIPILNQAPSGPLAMISPANTYLGLTRSGPGTEPFEPDGYYPTGIRSYARVVAVDDIQGAANAVLAKRLGIERIFLVDDGSGYGKGIASAVATAARRLGLRVIGPQFAEPGFEKTLVAQVKATRADAVFLGMGLFPESARLVRTLRAGLPLGVRILAPDGFSPPSALVRAVGPAAEGMTVSTAGLPNSQLPPAGKRFVEEFGRAVGQEPYQWPAAAAQATEVLLDAIARSDGTRASVAHELFETDVKDGILGDFSIDKNGDTTAGAITIYRIVKGKPKVFKVITPSPSLVR
jgi:branched-chain amino acid transport system substrate-binding protein